MSLSQDDLELIELVREDLLHIQKECQPNCTDHQLRRISVQLRQLLVEDKLVRVWKLLDMDPKQPIVLAPRLRHKELDDRAVAVAGGGQIGGVRIANVKFTPGKASTEAEIKARYEREKQDIECQFHLADYKQSCGLFIKGTAIQRRQIVAYVANKKGGAHLDTRRKKDEDAYKCLDDAIKSGLLFGGQGAVPVGGPQGSKNSVYLELLSIGQQLTASPDIVRLVNACEAAVKNR